MARISFYGATGTVTGSRYILEVDDSRLMVDCGLFQGSKQNRLKNWDRFQVEPASLDRVFLTHGHIDHIGYLPRLGKEGFKGKVHCTHATADLCDILLKDSAHIQEEDARWANKKGYSKHKPALPLYTVADAEKVLTHFRPVHLGDDIQLNSDLRVKFKDSGHILGAAFVDIKRRGNGASRKVLFSGDLGRSSRPILRDPDQVFNVDYLVLESTYGDRLHEETSPQEKMAQIISATVKKGGSLIIPSFSIGRTQTMLYIIRQMEEDGRIPSLPVYADSPMAIEALAVFEKRVSEMDMELRMEVLEGRKVFRPSQLHICRTPSESKAINDVDTPAIIISASGMATAGRILHHLRRRLPDPKTTVLLVGYQAWGTRGRDMLEGKKEVKIHGRMVPVRADIESIMGFSGHADYREIMAWLMGFNRPPEKTFIVHGEPEASESLAEKIRSRFGWETVVPEFGDGFDIDL